MKISTKNGENMQMKTRMKDNGDVEIEWTQEMIDSGNIFVDGVELKEYLAALKDGQQ